MQKKDPQKKKNETNDHYKLNTSAVDRLVNAKNKSYPETKKDPGKQYRSKGFIDKIPSPVKAVFIKFWFNGAVCYFILWGLGMLVNSLDLILILGVVLGMVNDLLINNAFRFFALSEGSNDKWMMFPKKKFWTFPLNIIYSTAVLYLVIQVYTAINILINTINGTTDKIALGVEPILFGLFFVAIDMLFIGMKNLLIKIFKDAKEKAAQ